MEIILSFWNVLVMMASWLLVGFLLAGVVSVLLPRNWVVGVMGRARGWRGGMEGGSSDPVVRLVCNLKVAEKIGLSEEQRGKIKEINKANRDNSEDLRKALLGRSPMNFTFRLGRH